MIDYRYVIERLAQSVITVLTVMTFAFFLMRQLPGGPAAYVRAQVVGAGEQLTEQQMNTLVRAYTGMLPDEPLHIQYLNYMEDVLFHFDLGKSFWYSRPVADILLDAMPWTIYISAVVLFGGFALNVLMGSIMAYKESSRFDTTATITFLVSGSVPYYIVAILLVYFLGFQLELFPDGDAYDQSLEPGFTVPFIMSVIYHSALPIASFIIARTVGSIGMRANAIRVLGADYLRVARLRGLPERRIATRYVARNAMLPAYTSLMIGIGTLFGGSVIMETIFAYPGVGYYTFEAFKASDYTLLMGGFVFTSVATVIGVLVGDFTYGIIDPRAGGEDREAY